MLKFGIIDQCSKGKARVKFEDVGIVSALIPITYTDTLTNPESFDLAEGTQVVCLMDHNCEYGAIIGAIYSDEDPVPSGSGSNVWVKKFEDGTVFSYNNTTHEYKIANSTTEFIINRTGGFALNKGGESLKSLISDTLDAITIMTMPVSGASAGPPVNAASFTAIKARLTAFFNA